MGTFNLFTQVFMRWIRDDGAVCDRGMMSMSDFNDSTVYILLATILELSTQVLVSRATSACLKPNCAYLPWVTRPTPARIAKAVISGSVAGTYRVVGAVTATGNERVYNVKVEFRAFDVQDHLIGVEARSAAFTATLSGQPNPFDLVTNIKAGDPVARKEIVVSSWSLTDDQTYAALTAVYTKTEMPGVWTEVMAQFRNDHPFPLYHVRAAAWSLAPPDNGIGAQPIADILAPGETVTFTSSLLYSGRMPVRVAAQGVVGPSQPAFSEPFSPPGAFGSGP